MEIKIRLCLASVITLCALVGCGPTTAPKVSPTVLITHEDEMRASNCAWEGPLFYCDIENLTTDSLVGAYAEITDERFVHLDKRYLPDLDPRRTYRVSFGTVGDGRGVRVMIIRHARCSAYSRC